jgi:L-seryl-tRNA(Ser) seleniumtransferase
MLSDAIDAGVDLVCASGDKLLGGPQAGIILGKSEVVEVLRRHPLSRALRADKTCLAGLSATLQHYVRGEAEECVPVWWMISRSSEWLQRRVNEWCSALNAPECEVVQTAAVVGGGSLPGMTLPSFALSITATNASVMAQRLRSGNPCVFPRIEDGRVLIDARTVLDGQDQYLVEALRTVIESN